MAINEFAPMFHPEITGEEIAVWLVITAEGTYIYHGVTAEQFAAAIAGDELNTPIIQHDNPQNLIGSPAVLWGDFGFKLTPKPDQNLLMTTSSWVWG